MTKSVMVSKVIVIPKGSNAFPSHWSFLSGMVTMATKMRLTNANTVLQSLNTNIFILVVLFDRKEIVNAFGILVLKVL